MCVCMCLYAYYICKISLYLYQSNQEVPIQSLLYIHIFLKKMQTAPKYYSHKKKIMFNIDFNLYILSKIYDTTFVGGQIGMLLASSQQLNSRGCIFLNKVVDYHL